MKFYDKIVVALFAIACILFIGYLFYSTKKSNQANLDRKFSGLVQKVNYDEKTIPTVTIHNKDYYLDAGYNFDRKIEKGDSLVKIKNSRIYKLFKSSGEVKEFD